MTKIYISSTYSDLVEHRQQVYDILRKMRYDVIAKDPLSAPFHSSVVPVAQGSPELA